MKRSLILFSSLLSVCAVAACGVERTSTVLGPTAANSAPGTPTSSAPSMIGTWVIPGSAAKPASSITSAPDFSSCGNFVWDVTSQTATEASGRFSADCSGGLIFAGTITGRLGGATVPISVTGSLSRGSDICPFSATGTGTPIDSQTFRISYSGTTCLGPMQGETTLSLAPHSAPPAPTTVTLSGTITEAISGGVLPAIEVRVGELLAVRTDGAGHYELPGVPATAASVQFAASGYVTQTKPLNLTANAVMDVVMARASTPPPAAPTPANGDQLDIKQVTVVGSNPSVLQFPLTAALRGFSVAPGAMSIRTSGTSGWPAVPIEAGGEPAQAGTLWLFLNINGRWYATGAERLRPSQLNGEKPEEGTPATLVGTEWLYDSRWGPMAHYNPRSGEIVGVMVAAGSTRSDDNTPVRERTNIILFSWP